MKITKVDRHSPAARAGIRVGEELTAVDGMPVRDVLDYKFYTADDEMCVTLSDEAGNRRDVAVTRSPDEELGLTFETYLMDRARSCANKCVFCFIDQLPEGMRDSLYFKDDDMRLSFLMGNYISMTNLGDADLERIIRMHISPLNISVQATDPDVRVRMLGNPRAARLPEQMRKLHDAGIVMNCQLVICPGINDGDVLEKSLRELTAMYPQVKSISVVPVGMTCHRDGLCPLTPVEKPEAEAILDIAEPVGEACLKAYGTRVVYCADELYLKSGRMVPPAAYYEDYPQLENGVGMMALFEDELRRLLMRETVHTPFLSEFSIATGVAAGDFMRRMLGMVSACCPGIRGRVYSIENDFFGRHITVAGLVTGSDLIRQLKGKRLGKRLLIPKVMLRSGEDVFLDDVCVGDVSRELGVKVIPVDTTADAFLTAVLQKRRAVPPADSRMF